MRKTLIQPRLQNIPLRTDLGAKIRKALRNQSPLPATMNYSTTEVDVLRLKKEP